MVLPAIHTLEFANSLNLSIPGNVEKQVFLRFCWIPCPKKDMMRKMKKVEKLWILMRKENVLPTVEGMSLYTKMTDSGHNPDRLTVHLMLKLLCEGEKFDWAVQVSQEIRIRGLDMDLASRTMLLHLFCKMKKWNEAFAAFEEMICRGIVPHQMAQALSKLMASVPHSTNLPNTYIEEEKDSPFLRRKAILQKAKAMSNALRTCKDPSKLAKRERPENDVESANRLIEEYNARIAKT
ncbi:hypothetical protein V2J09_001373 [Rumex salicifolius]